MNLGLDKDFFNSANTKLGIYKHFPEIPLDLLYLCYCNNDFIIKENIKDEFMHKFGTINNKQLASVYGFKGYKFIINEYIFKIKGLRVASGEITKINNYLQTQVTIIKILNQQNVYLDMARSIKNTLSIHQTRDLLQTIFMSIIGVIFVIYFFKEKHDNVVDRLMNWFLELNYIQNDIKNYFKLEIKDLYNINKVIIWDYTINMNSDKLLWKECDSKNLNSTDVDYSIERTPPNINRKYFYKALKTMNLDQGYFAKIPKDLYYIAFKRYDSNQVDYYTKHFTFKYSTSNHQSLEFYGDGVFGVITTRLLYNFNGLFYDHNVNNLFNYLESNKSITELTQDQDFCQTLQESVYCSYTNKLQKHNLCADSFEALIGAIYFYGIHDQADIIEILYKWYIDLVYSKRFIKDVARDYDQHEIKWNYKIDLLDGWYKPLAYKNTKYTPYIPKDINDYERYVKSFKELKVAPYSPIFHNKSLISYSPKPYLPNLGEEQPYVPKLITYVPKSYRPF